MRAERSRKYRATKRGHLASYLDNAKTRAKTKQIAFDLDLDFLESIATDECPVFKTPFVWGQVRDQERNTPSLDRIIPELGYIKHNVVFISAKANSIKQEVTEKELYAVADWLHEKRKEVLRAEEERFASVSNDFNREGEVDPEPSAVPAAGIGQDSDDAHHHCGADARHDVDCSTEARSRDSMGSGDEEMGTSKAPNSQQDTRQPSREDPSFEKAWGNLCSELGELSMVVGEFRDAIRQSNHRRVESLQGSVDEAFQSAEKTLKELQETYYPNGDAYTPGST